MSAACIYYDCDAVNLHLSKRKQDPPRPAADLTFFLLSTIYYKCVSHIPQKESTGSLPLNSERPSSLSMTALIVTSLKE